MIAIGPQTWATTSVGTVVNTERGRHGLHFRRNFDDKVYSDFILLKRDDGELTTRRAGRIHHAAAGVGPSCREGLLRRNIPEMPRLAMMSRWTSPFRQKGPTVDNPMTITPLTRLFQTHSRSFEDNRFVYAVVSRRSGGVSIGVNLNPDKYCNFDCVYCQVDRTVPGTQVLRKLDLPQLRDELDEMVELATGGGLFESPRFSATPPEYRRLNDIAMSGDGEPTVSPIFDEVVATLRRRPRRPRSRRRETRVDHQRHDAPAAAGRQSPGNLRRQQRRNLGQARRGHGGLLSTGRSHRGQAGRGDGEPDRHRAEAADRDSIALHATGRRSRRRRPSRKPIATV